MEIAMLANNSSQPVMVKLDGLPSHCSRLKIFATFDGEDQLATVLVPEWHMEITREDESAHAFHDKVCKLIAEAAE
jgi:hypothetical protein